jgi:hypothetical protein
MIMIHIQINPLIWMVSASTAIAVGTTATLMTILDYNLIAGMHDTNTILSIGGITIGLIGLVIGYYSQNNPDKIMDSLLTRVKKRERGKEYYYLNRIISSASLITKYLVRLEGHIARYSDEPPPKDWQIVRYTADRSKKKTEELGKKIILDFTQIIDLVENSHLADKFGANSLYQSLYLFDETLRINPEYDEELLRELRNGIREHIEQLNDAISSLKKEKEKKIY